MLVTKQAWWAQPNKILTCLKNDNYTCYSRYDGEQMIEEHSLFRHSFSLDKIIYEPVINKSRKTNMVLQYQ